MGRKAQGSPRDSRVAELSSFNDSSDPFFCLKRVGKAMKTAQMTIAILIKLLWVVAASAMEIQLQWDPNTEPDLAGYKVYYGIDGLANHAHLDVSNQTVATISGLDPASNYSFAVTAYNTSGLESSYSNIVTALEAVPPSVSISYPASGTIVSGTVSVTAAANDNVGVNKVEFFVNGTLHATETSAPYMFSWDTTSLASGNYTLSAKAYDAANNAAPSSTVIATVNNTIPDSTAPTVSITIPTNNESISGTATVAAAASDDIGVSRVDFYLNGTLRASVNAAPYSFSWDTTAGTNGPAALYVKAYDTTGNIGISSSITVTVSNPTAPIVSIASGVTITPSLASPQRIGTPITITATGQGGTGSYEYQFWFNNGTSWTMVQDYSTTSTWDWSTAGSAPGTYRLQVNVRGAGSTVLPYEAARGIDYVISPPSATDAHLSATPSNPTAAGPAVTFSAGGVGGSGSYEYQFWFNNGTSWTMVQDYSTTSTWNWSTAGLAPGTYRIQANVRNAGSTVLSYEAAKGIDFVIKPPAATAAHLSATASSPTAAGPAVTFSAGGAGGSGSYEYQFWLNNGSSWTMVQDYSTTSSWDWNTAGLAPGSYAVQVNVRNSGSTVLPYEAATNVNYLLL